MSRADIVLGLLALAAGAAILPMSLALPHLPQSYAGPSLFPSIIGGLMMLAGLVITVNGLRAQRAAQGSEASEEGGPSAAPSFAWRRIVEVGVAVALYLILAPRLGFVVGAFVMVASLLFIRGNRITTALVVALVLALIVRWLFLSLLKVPLPVGPWGW